MPNAHLDLVEDSVDSMISARNALFNVMFYIMVVSMMQLFSAVFLSSALDPLRMVKIYGGLTSAGINLVLNSAVICSMYGIYYDSELGLPVVNYVPGWAYVNFSMIFSAIVACGLMIVCNIVPKTHPLYNPLFSFLCLLCVYLLIWIMIPLWFGYARSYPGASHACLASTWLTAASSVSLCLSLCSQVHMEFRMVIRR